MKFLLPLIFFAFSASAQEAALPTQFPAPSPLVFDFEIEDIVKPKVEIEPFSAKIRVLNKRTSETTEYELNNQTIVQHNSLEILVLNCLKNYNDKRGQDIGWLEINSTEGQELFSGWMYKEFPSMNALDHPVYDIRLVGCKKR